MEDGGEQMLKAVFIDYTGTMVREDEPYTRELVRYFASHSELKDPHEILRVVWTRIKEIEAESYGDSFRKNDEKVDFILEYCAREHGLLGDFSYIHEVWHKVWTYAPLYDDVSVTTKSLHSGFPIKIFTLHCEV